MTLLNFTITAYGTKLNMGPKEKRLVVKRNWNVGLRPTSTAHMGYLELAVFEVISIVFGQSLAIFAERRFWKCYKRPDLHMTVSLFTKQALSSWFNYSNHQSFLNSYFLLVYNHDTKSTGFTSSLSPKITSSFSIQSPNCNGVIYWAPIAYRNRFLAFSLIRCLSLLSV